MASKGKSDIMNVAGLLMNIVIGIVKAVYAKGGTDEDIRRLAGEEGRALLDEIAKLIVSASRQSFEVLVDCTKSLVEMIQAGSYGYVDSNINDKNFKVEGQGQQEVEVVLFHFKRAISTDDALQEMEKAGYRPARIEELLALGAAYPELQRQFPIVALGSLWQDPRGDRRVAYLNQDGAGRSLDLPWFESDWRECYRFVAVRK
jgi:hypothetical protein